MPNRITRLKEWYETCCVDTMIHSSTLRLVLFRTLLLILAFENVEYFGLLLFLYVRSLNSAPNWLKTLSRCREKSFLADIDGRVGLSHCELNSVNS